ncbi:hypothetical protein, partial [Escherichia coli]|uniref:hypothetical protein n=1 Tax=Escherichia coli TaxID=562 RepID=UPI001954DAED
AMPCWNLLCRMTISSHRNSAVGARQKGGIHERFQLLGTPAGGLLPASWRSLASRRTREWL